MTTGRPRNRTILVTGGAGFIGGHLASDLVTDNDVRILDSLATGERSNVPDGATFIEGDIRDQATVDEAIDGCDIVYHQAALVSVPRSIETPVASHEINTMASLKLLEGAREEGARVVLASSAAIYGHPERVPVPEAAPKTPASPYGLEKLTADHYTHLYHDLYDLDTVALRYFNVYGPGQIVGEYSGVISTFIDQALSGEDITVLGEGAPTRDFVFIDDVVQANRKAATTDAVGAAYNVGTGESITIRELAELVQELTDTGSDIVHYGSRPGDIKHSTADVSRTKADLEYEPTVSIREGLERTIEWYRTRRNE